MVVPCSMKTPCAMVHFGVRGWQRVWGDERKGYLQGWGVCRGAVPTGTALPVERRGSSTVGAADDAQGK